jgi:hypothetical protein
VAQEKDWLANAAEDYRPPVDMRTDIPHPARMYDYFLGGKDNFEADREAAERALAVSPLFRDVARVNRAFLRRAVRYVAGQGIRQFLDIGTGIPTAGNTHQVAQAIDPGVRVAYVDNDPIVLTHARTLMSGPGQGATAVVEGDLRDPEAILADPEVRALLDFGQPVALLLVAVLHFIEDGEDPYGVVERLVDALPPGSFLVLSHASAGDASKELADAATKPYENAAARLVLRPYDAIGKFFGDRLELVEPGLVAVATWHPETEPTEDEAKLWFYGAVARRTG